ncbi:MAG: hypothetical protein HYT83_04260 [Candidatus Levybacteria bacterium]|nr:hypothetical protein [Candidatus Levybacteria bacterium]
MNESFKKLLSDKILTWILLTTIIIIFITLIPVTIFYAYLPPFIPIFNQLPWGIDQLGNKLEIFIPIILSITVLIANMFFAVNIYKKVPLLSRMLSVTSLLIAFLVLLFIIRTLQLVL